MVAGLGALYALVLAAAPVREFFDLELLSAGQWFLCLLSVRGRAGARRARPGASPTSRRSRRRPSRRPAEPRARGDPPRDRAGAPAPRPTPGRAHDADDRTAASRRRRTKIVATIGPATRSVERAGGADPGRRRRPAAQLLARHARRARRERRDGPRGGASGRPRGRPARGPARGRSCGSTRSRAAWSSSREGSELTLTTGEGIGGRRPPARLVGRASRRRSTRATRSTSPTAGFGCGSWARRPDEVRCAVEVGGRGRLAPGAEPARDRGAAARRRAAPTSTGSTSRSSRASTCSRSRSSAAPRTCSRSSAASGSPAPTSR